jgi:hypothetical protein
MVGGDRFALGEGADGFESLAAKDLEPLAQLGEINPQQVSDVVWLAACSNGENGGETLVDTPIKRFLAAAFDFPPLLRRQDNRLHS